MAFFPAGLDRFQRMLLGSAAAVLLVLIVMKFGTFAAMLYSRYVR